MAEENIPDNMPLTIIDPDIEWSTREKLAIASYVLRSGEQHWSGVGRLLRPLGEPGRSPEWFNPKFCAQQYTALLEQIDAPKRKRGIERSESSENIQPASSQEEVIVSRLTKERIEELKKQLRLERTEYRKLKREIELIESGDVDDKLDELIDEIENEGRETEDVSEPSLDDVVPARDEIEQIDSLAEEVRNEIEKLQSSAFVDEPIPTDEIDDITHDKNTVSESDNRPEAEDIMETMKVDELSTNETLSNVVQQNQETKSKNDIVDKSESYDVTGAHVNVISPEKHTDHDIVEVEEVEEKTTSTTKSKLAILEIASQKNDSEDTTDALNEIDITKRQVEDLDEEKVEIETPRKESKDDTISSEIIEESDNTFNYSMDDSLHHSISLPGTPATSGGFVFDSFPSSPALSHSSDMDPDAAASWKAWRKSIMILWKQVASHRYASLFLQPVTDDIAPNYSTTVYRSIDLSTLKKNIESGVIRTTNEFHRDLMLMFQNAIMYNNREHDVYMMTTEMQKDVMDQVAQFKSTQMMVETAQPPVNKSLRRSTMRRSALSEKVGDSRTRKSTTAEPDAKFSR